MKDDEKEKKDSSPANETDNSSKEAPPTGKHIASLRVMISFSGAIMFGDNKQISIFCYAKL